MEKKNNILLIKELMRNEKYDEALKLCKQVEFMNDLKIQLLTVDILIKLKKYDEALEICNKEEYVHIKDFRKRNKYINSVKNDEINENPEEISKTRNYLTEIYANICTEDDIKNSDLNEWIKQILLIAYYEKNNKVRGTKFIKIIKETCEDLDKIRILNNLYTRLNGKKNRFDIGIYEKILKTRIDFLHLEEIKKYDNSTSNIVLQKDKEEEIPKKEMIEKNIEPEFEGSTKTSLRDIIKFGFSSNKIDEKVNANSDIHFEEKKDKKESKKYIVQGGGVTNNRYNHQKNKESKKEENESKSKKVDNVLIKDVFSQQVEEVEKYLYVKMQSNDCPTQQKAIKTWDIFENMINKPINDQNNLRKFLNFIKRVAESNTLEIELNEAFIRKLEKEYL